MTSRRFGEFWYIQCLPSSLAATRSIVLLTPQGLPQRELEHVALSSYRLERRGPGYTFAVFDRVQRFSECKGIIRLDRRERFARETEARKDRFSQSDRIVQTGEIVARLGAEDHAHRRRAVSESRGDCFEADLRHLVDSKRQNIGGQSVAVT